MNKDELYSSSSFLECPVWFDKDKQIYWNELPKNMDLSKYYGEEYWSKFRTKKGLLYKIILNSYKKIRFFFSIPPNVSYSDFLLYRKYINKNSKYFEVGCGEGENIISLNKRGYNVGGGRVVFCKCC